MKKKTENNEIIGYNETNELLYNFERLACE